MKPNILRQKEAKCSPEHPSSVAAPDVGKDETVHNGHSYAKIIGNKSNSNRLIKVVYPSHTQVVKIIKYSGIVKNSPSTVKTKTASNGVVKTINDSPIKLSILKSPQVSIVKNKPEKAPKSKSVLDEFLETMEQFTPSRSQKFVPESSEDVSNSSTPSPARKNYKNCEAGEHISPQKTTRGHNRSHNKSDQNSSIVSEVSKKSALSLFLHFKPNRRVPPLVNPIADVSVEDHCELMEAEQCSQSSLSSLNSIFNSYVSKCNTEKKQSKERPKKVSISEAKKLIKAKQQVSNPTLETCMELSDSEDNSESCSKYSSSFSALFGLSNLTPLPVQQRPEDKTNRKRAHTISSSNSGFCTSSGPKRLKRSLRKIANDDRQLVLDFGQKSFGPQWCKTCGFVYTPSHPEDLQLHEKFHNRKLALLKYTLRGSEDIVQSYEDGVILKVKGSSEQFSSDSLLERKVAELKEKVDADLGFIEDKFSRENRTTLVFLSAESYLVGYLMAEQIEHGYRVVIKPEKASSVDDVHLTTSLDHIGNSWSCSLVPEPALCGVSRIWVAQQFQRRRIASRLVDVLRTIFLPGNEVDRELLAFSDPTNPGRRFASMYTGREDFLVFKCVQSEPGRPVRDFLKEEEERDKLLLLSANTNSEVHLD